MSLQQSQSSGAKSLIARDRVLLYTRGMNIPPDMGVELALQSMRGAGPDAEASAVMEELFAILRETGMAAVMPEQRDEPIASAPPIHRTTVLPRDMEPLSFTAAALLWLRNLPGRLSGKQE